LSVCCSRCLPGASQPRFLLVIRRSPVLRRVDGIYKNPNHLAIAPGMENHGVWFQPLDSDLVLGDVKKWAANANVAPSRIPGYWLGRPGDTSDLPSGAPPAPGEKVVLVLHGGAYVTFSANPNDHPAAIARGLLKHVPSVRRVLSVEYRLSAAAPYPPANPFPAALLDALAGYAYLVHVVGFRPADIIVEGDSAGGNLALALTRYLVENAGAFAAAAAAAGAPVLSPPGAIVLLSPWCDLGTSHDRPPQPYLARSDFVHDMVGSTAKYAATAFTGPLGLAAADTNVYISPASKAVRPSFAGWPRAFVVAGGAEWLAESIRTLKERMSADMGEGAGGLTYYEPVDAVHDYISLPWHEPERTETLIKIAEWVEGA
jgi:acetyl esterase/lipase